MSRCKIRIAIDKPQPKISGPKYLRLARIDQGLAAAMTSAVSARYAARKKTMKSLMSSTGSYVRQSDEYFPHGPNWIHSRAPLTS